VEKNEISQIEDNSFNGSNFSHAYIVLHQYFGAKIKIEFFKK
jgi:hypothetical protein